jgi:hypothetical protein
MTAVAETAAVETPQAAGPAGPAGGVELDRDQAFRGDDGRVEGADEDLVRQLAQRPGPRG